MGQSRRVDPATDLVLADIGLRFLTEFILRAAEGLRCVRNDRVGGYAKVSVRGSPLRNCDSRLSSRSIRTKGAHSRVIAMRIGHFHPHRWPSQGHQQFRTPTPVVPNAHPRRSEQPPPSFRPTTPVIPTDHPRHSDRPPPSFRPTTPVIPTDHPRHSDRPPPSFRPTTPVIPTDHPRHSDRPPPSFRPEGGI